MFVWGSSGEGYNTECVQCASDFGDVVKNDGIMNEEMYHQILIHRLEKGLSANDRQSKQTAKAAKETEDYAPESPDLNIIEGKQNKGQNPNKERWMSFKKPG